MKLLNDEIFKTFRKWRTYIGFIAIAALVALVFTAMKIDGGDFVRHQTGSLQRDFLFVGNLFNVWFVTHMLMNVLWIHVPFLISLVAGDILAGEATAGTFRILLIRPASRTRIFTAKFIASLVYTVALVFFLGILSVVVGVILFGTGDILIVDRAGVLVLPASEAWWRFALAFTLAAGVMVSVSSLAILFSSFVENAIGPIVGTMAVIIVFTAIGLFPVPVFEPVKPYLFTTYLDVWAKAFDDPVPWSEIARYVSIIGAFSFAFAAGAWLVFTRKDITS